MTFDSSNKALELKSSSTDRLQKLLLRANASLCLDKIPAAFEDAHESLLMDIGNRNALSLAVYSSYQLSYFELCDRHLRRALDLYPTDDLFLEGRKRVNRRLSELHGHYSFSDMYSEANLSPFQPLDRASYVGPVEIRQCSDQHRGLGMFVTKDVKVGDLLFVEKAFAAVFVDDRQETATVHALGEQHDETKLRNDGGQEFLAEICCKLVSLSPSLEGILHSCCKSQLIPPPPPPSDTAALSMATG